MEPANKVQRTSERLFKYAMLGPAVLWVIAFTFFPIFSALNYSFSNYVLGRGITNYVGFKNYIIALTDGGFWHSLLITLVYVGVAVPLEVCIGFLFAWVITVGLPGKGFFRSVLTAPLFTMEVAIGYLGVTLFTSAARCSLLIALFRQAQFYSATLPLFKVESGINGLLPTSWVPSIYSVSRLSRLRSALGGGYCILRSIALRSLLATVSQPQKLLALCLGKQSREVDLHFE